MTTSRTHQGLRPEATSVWLDRMTQGQERAFGDLVRLIEAATVDLPMDDEWTEDPDVVRDVETKQVSRLLFLGGGRGSGKTTVARSLHEALDPRRDSRLFGYEVDKDGSQRDQGRFGLKTTVEKLREQVIALEPLGLADTPEETNLLSALLARIEGLLFPRLASEDVRSTTGDRRQHDAILELLRLQTDVALAWNGNLKDRRGRLDPDNYAMEEMRVERVRLQLRHRFERVLRRTARETLGRGPSLFLLIVDDTDADPKRLIELLERLRMVAVPELLILLVGDIEPIETAFRMHYANRYRGTAPQAIGMAEEELSALTNLVARSALRKHLPDHQQVMLPPRLRADEAMALFPLRREVEEIRIRTTLQQTEVTYPPVPHLVADREAQLMTLESFAFPCSMVVPADEASGVASEQSQAMDRAVTGLTQPDQQPDSSPDDRQQPGSSSDDCWYTGSYLLADSPRIAVDMWYALFDAWAHGEPQGPPPEEESMMAPTGFGAKRLDSRLHAYVRRLALERLDANAKLWRNSRTAVPWTVGDRFIRLGDPTDLGFKGKHVIEGDRAEKPLRPEGGSHIIHWTRHYGLTFEIHGIEASRVDVGPLVLAEDLAALENRQVARQAVKNRASWELAWVEAESVEPDPTANDGTEKSENGEKVRTRTPWPIPRYRTTRQIEQFGDEWNAYLASNWSAIAKMADHHEAHKTLMHELANAWVTIHTRILVGEEPADIAGDFGVEDEPSLPAVTMDQLAELRGHVTSDDLDDWARLVAADWLRSVDTVLETVGRADLQRPIGGTTVDGLKGWRQRLDDTIGGGDQGKKPEALAADPESAAAGGTSG